MTTRFVQLLCDIDCEWEETSPVYRIYVGNDLFSERTWIWRDQYLEEMLQISTKPGVYPLRFELVEPELGKLTVSNFRVIQGIAQVAGNTLEIW